MLYLLLPLIMQVVHGVNSVAGIAVIGRNTHYFVVNFAVVLEIQDAYDFCL